MGASGSSSKQKSSSTQASDASTFVNQEQQPFLTSLWQQAMGQANPEAAQAAAQGAANTVLPGLSQLFGQATGAGQAGLQAFKASQAPLSPSGTLAALMNPQGQIDAQTNSLRAGLNQQWEQDLLPGLRGNAIQAGGFGGGRQGVAEGVAAGGMFDALTKGRGDIVANANNQALQAQDLWQTSQANRAQNGIAAGQLGLQAGQIGQGLSSAITAAMTLPSVAGLDPLARLAEILGSPNVLSKQVSSGSSSAKGKSASFGFSLT